MKNEFEEKIMEKLDLIIKLLSQINLDPEATQTQSILKLNKLGIKPNQIASILNTTSNYVNMILSKKRKGDKNG